MIRRVTVPGVARKAGLGRIQRGLASQAAGMAHMKASWLGVTTSGSVPSTESAGPAKNHTGMPGPTKPGCQAWPNFTASH